jgi:hypothetical protein
VNNENHQATLVVLDPLKVSGVVTPKEMTDHHFHLQDMAQAHETAVVLFPRSCISEGQPYAQATALFVNNERIVVTVAERPFPEYLPTTFSSKAPFLQCSCVEVRGVNPRSRFVRLADNPEFGLEVSA